MTLTLRRAALALLLLLVALTPVRALDELVQKRSVRLRNFAFVSGQTVPDLQLGYEVYGHGDWRFDPVILVCHYLAGDGHAAGRYARTDPSPGWWDQMIGPGRALDTNRFVVIATDLPCSLKSGKDPRVIAPGPASVDPSTGRRWGLTFPRVTVRDMVRMQKALLDQLGVPRLRAVTGPSLGGMLAWQWAVEYPTYVEQAIPVAGPVTFTALDRQGFLNAGAAVMSDPAWMYGNYYGTGLEPTWGLAHAMYGLSMISSGEGWSFYLNLSSYLKHVGRYDPNDYLYMAGLHVDYELGREHGGLDPALRRVQARVSVVGSDDDAFISPDELREATAALTRAGVTNELILFPGTHGHLSVLEDLPVLEGALARALR